MPDQSRVHPIGADPWSQAPTSQSDAARLQRYRQYLDLYTGRHWTQQSSTRRTRLTLNYARAVVDKGVSYLFGIPIAHEVLAPPGAGERLNRAAREAEQLLEHVLEDTDEQATLIQAATNAGVLGDAVLKVFWDPVEARVRVVNVDPFCFRAWRAPDDYSRLVQVELQYAVQALPDAGGRPGPLRRVSERWTPTHLTISTQGDQERQLPNPYGLVPFVHVPNLPAPNDPWGTSDLADVAPLQAELNARVSDQSDIIRFHADPPVVFRGVTEHSDLAVGPGTVWDIPADADVKLLEWTGHTPDVQAHLDRLQRAIWDVSETPRTAFGDSGRLLSGVALEIELRPLIQRTLRKRAFWGPALRQRNRLILAIAEQQRLLRPGAAQLRTAVVWPPLVPRDATQEVRNQVALVAARLRSHRTAMEALGQADVDQELARITEDLETLAGSRTEPQHPV